MTTIKEIKTRLAKHIEDLPEKEKLVISMYYSDEMTMKEIGLTLEITESRVSQIHSQAVLRLRNKLRKDGLLEDK
jgi:RNA polymerase sigma factor for flagellar operon FliA